MNRPLRVLHVLGALDRGGAETWLVHVLRHSDRRRFVMDFLVHREEPGHYDDEAHSLGARIIRATGFRNPVSYARAFSRILREDGPYDVVHSHVHHYSGFVLKLARRSGVAVRVAHSHLDSAATDAAAGLLRRSYLALMRRWLDRHATACLASSREAASALFGADWGNDRRKRVLYCSIDLEPFRREIDREAVRSELGIPRDAFVLGHVGRFDPQKNHEGLVETAAELARKEPSMRLLLVGAGKLRPVIEEKVARAGLRERTVFAGVRKDVPRLMRGAMDVFVLPSFHEGLPLVALEAQAAGLPCVLSDRVSQETDIVPASVRRLSLSRAPSEWADAILAARGTAPTREQALSLIERSPFDVRNGARALERFYAAA